MICVYLAFGEFKEREEERTGKCLNFEYITLGDEQFELYVFVDGNCNDPFIRLVALNDDDGGSSLSTSLAKSGSHFKMNYYGKNPKLRDRGTLKVPPFAAAFSDQSSDECKEPQVLTAQLKGIYEMSPYLLSHSCPC